MEAYFSVHSLEIHCIGLLGPEPFPRLGLGTKACHYNFLFLVENYDYLRSRIIFWEEGHIVSSSFCALPPLLLVNFVNLNNK